MDFGNFFSLLVGIKIERKVLKTYFIHLWPGHSDLYPPPPLSDPASFIWPSMGSVDLPPPPPPDLPWGAYVKNLKLSENKRVPHKVPIQPNEGGGAAAKGKGKW